MVRRVLLAILLTAFQGAAGAVTPGAAGQTDGVSFEYREREGRDSLPRTDVSLTVHGRRFLIRSNVVGKFRNLERSEYAEHQVPGAAVAAGTGWWAGQGEDIYVVRRGNQLVVYVRELDESAGASKYRRRRVIPLPRR